MGGLSLGVIVLTVLVFVEKRQSSPLLDIKDMSNPRVMLAIFNCLAASVMTGIKLARKYLMNYSLYLSSHL
jgi:hypothetical protein